MKNTYKINKKGGHLMNNSRRTVAIYARVSTEHEAQLSAFDNQIQHYENLLALHPEWDLYKIYSDEGVTGTSIRKRKGFLQMLDDAAAGKFDLIVTREISRFARNTVDALEQIRKLKKQGVEVYFEQENIWSLKEDCDLLLSIMASIAESESKKISERVKAGQKISFENGVLYGNGNILGYDRVGKEMKINPEQAKTVRMIYDMYLDGKSMPTIKYELEVAERLTSKGLKNWDAGNISRILNNSFYCGIIKYNKEYVPDYLEQKKVKNFGEVEQIVVEGNHETIVTKEEYDRVQSILESKRTVIDNRGARGKRTSNDIWCKKLKCVCGSSVNRKIWRKCKDGKEYHYAYQCYSQVRTGTVKKRLEKGLSIEGICDTPMIPSWKLGAMSDVIFQNFFDNPEDIVALAKEMLEGHFFDEKEENVNNEIKNIRKEIETQKGKQKKLLDLFLLDSISMELLEEKQREISKEIEGLEKVLARYQAEDDLTDEMRRDKLNVLKASLDKSFNFSTHAIPAEVIDEVIDEVIVHKDYFVFKLNLDCYDVIMQVEGRKNKFTTSLRESPFLQDSSSGSYQQQIINKSN